MEQFLTELAVQVIAGLIVALIANHFDRQSLDEIVRPLWEERAPTRVKTLGISD